MGSVDAERMVPLALMIRPHGSSPHHSRALVLALTAIRASKPFPLVHITSSAPSMLIALGVWSRALMVHSCRVIRRMRYGTGSTRERHDDRGGPSSDTA